MDEAKTESADLRPIIQGVIEEFVRAQQVKAEPAYKAELIEERRRREDLERRMDELVQENQRSRQIAEDMKLAKSLGLAEHPSVIKWEMVVRDTFGD